MRITPPIECFRNQPICPSNNFCESRRQPGKGVGVKPSRPDWRRRLSVQLKDTELRILQVIRPCRESKTGWRPAANCRTTITHLILNEHGPELKFFCIPSIGIGCRALCRRLDEIEPPA